MEYSDDKSIMDLDDDGCVEDVDIYAKEADEDDGGEVEIIKQPQDNIIQFMDDISSSSDDDCRESTLLSSSTKSLAVNYDYINSIKNSANHDNIDLKTLNILINSPKDLKSFIKLTGENIFNPKYRKFYRHLSSYCSLYETSPTLDNLLEHIRTASSNKAELLLYISDTWKEVSSIGIIEPKEFNYCIVKLNERYKLELVKHIHTVTGSANANNINSILQDDVYKVVSEIKSVGIEKAYKSVTLQEHIPSWKQRFIDKIRNKELAQGVLTGFSMLDYFLNGLKKASLSFVCAATGGGKSIFLLNLAVNCMLGKNKLPTTKEEIDNIVANNLWQKGYNVLYFSLEMPLDELYDRIICNLAEVDSIELSKGNVTKEQIERIALALYFIEKCPNKIKIVDIPRGCGLAQAQQILDEAKEDGLLFDLVIFDYLGLMVDGAESDVDWEKMKNVSEEMHEFSRYNELAVFSALQLTTEDPSKKMLVGLNRIGRSRMIAHNANLILQIEDRQDEDLKPDAKLHVIKNRGGPKFVIDNLRKEFQYSRFVDLGYNGPVQQNVLLPPAMAIAREQEFAGVKEKDLSSMISEIFGSSDII